MKSEVTKGDEGRESECSASIIDGSHCLLLYESGPLASPLFFCPRKEGGRRHYVAQVSCARHIGGLPQTKQQGCITKLGGAGDMFGDYLGMDCVNLPLRKLTQSMRHIHLAGRKCRHLAPTKRASLE